MKESPRDLGSIRKVRKDSPLHNQRHGSLSFRQFTEEDILAAAVACLHDSIGNASTVTVSDIYAQLLGNRGSRAWENESFRKYLTSRKIGQILRRAGFVNIKAHGRSAKYQAP